jgi:hypothetical protein
MAAEPQLTLIFQDGHTQTIRNYVMTPSTVIVIDEGAGCSAGRVGFRSTDILRPLPSFRIAETWGCRNLVALRCAFPRFLLILQTVNAELAVAEMAGIRPEPRNLGRPEENFPHEAGTIRGSRLSVYEQQLLISGGTCASAATHGNLSYGE